MQVICVLTINPEQYVAEGYHRQMLPPGKCPHCSGLSTLWSLGYYCRNLSRLGSGVLRIWVRRFRCWCCGKTVSLLPSFAQPYRFVQNRTIEKYVQGDAFSDEVIRHVDLLARYWRRFCLWVPELERVLNHALERAPPRNSIAVWDFLMSTHGDLASATKILVTAFQITPFGRYHCHRPNGQKAK